MTVFVVGRFPPPVDGQTIATERLADLLESDAPIIRADTEPSLQSAGGALSRAVHFLRLRPFLRGVLAHDAEGTVLWTSISPDPMGHLRDLTISLPAFRSKHRVFAVVHRGNFRKLFESQLTAATARRLVKRMDGFVFLTHHLSAECAHWIPEQKRIVIPNTIDDDLAFTDAEVTMKQRRRTERTRLRVLFVGHMIRSKGYLDALEAIGRLHRQGLDIEGHFVGRWRSASDQNAFLEQVAADCLSKVIIHHGAVEPRAAVKALYAKADVLILPTYYSNEAQPLVILEALNAGIPVVSTPHAGIPEMIRDGRDGLLVPPEDPESLADAVRQLVDVESWHRYSKNARRRFLDTYSPQEVRKLWRAVIDA